MLLISLWVLRRLRSGIGGLLGDSFYIYIFITSFPDSDSSSSSTSSSSDELEVHYWS